jgi:putative Holliday junction resolvase
MGHKILAADIGERRIGLAISDELGMLAHPYQTLIWNGLKQFIVEIKQIITNEDIIKLVIGMPYTLKGELSEKTEEIKEICTEIRKQINIEVVEIDERLTTKMAERAFHAVGKKPSKNREKIDQIAAVFILQSYLDQTN